MRMVVVLPQPDGPTSTTVSPRPISRERSPTAGRFVPANVFDTWRSEIITRPSPPPAAASRSAITDIQSSVRSSSVSRTGLGAEYARRASADALRLEPFEGVAARPAEVCRTAERRPERALHDRVLAA